MKLAAVILAAGLGTRMKSGLAKVLHHVGGVPLIFHPVTLARASGADRVVVVLGHQLDAVTAFLAERFQADAPEVASQAQQRGTGHAVQQALPLLDGFEGAVLILYGDVPLLSPPTVARLTAAYEEAGTLAFLTMRPESPHGYGRVVRDDRGLPVRIVEQRDASAEEQAIGEVNAGIYCVEAGFLREALTELSDDNAQGELYLTDMVARAAQTGPVATVEAGADEVMGINDRVELARANARWREEACHRLMRAGVTIRDPATCYLEVDVTIGRDAVIAPLVTLAGRTLIEERVVVEPGCTLRDCTVGAGARIGAGSVLVGRTVPPEAVIEPLSRL